MQDLSQACSSGFRRVAIAVWIALGSLLPSAVGVAEPPLQDFQTWTQLQATLGLGRWLRGLSLNLEGTVRRGSLGYVNDSGQVNDAALTYLFVRPSLQLEVRKGVVPALGYAFAPVFYDDDALRAQHDVREQRVWQQLTLSHAFGHVGLASRTRLEERMRTRGPGAGDTELRLRQRFRAAFQLIEHAPWQVVLTDEVFFFLNDTKFSSEPGFSENRGFVGLGYKTDALNIEFGYLDQFVGGPASAHHRVNHVLSTSVTFKLEPMEPMGAF